MSYKFDNSKFTKEIYNKERIYGGYIGTIHVGMISIDVTNCSEIEKLSCDFYVLGEDNGYGYTKTGEPYDEAGGFVIDFDDKIPYDEVLKEIQSKAIEYIKGYKGEYSLKRKAETECAIDW